MSLELIFLIHAVSKLKSVLGTYGQHRGSTTVKKRLVYRIQSMSFSVFRPLLLLKSHTLYLSLSFLPSRTLSLSLSLSLSLNLSHFNAVQLTELYLETRVMLQAKPETLLCIRLNAIHGTTSVHQFGL